MDDRRQWTVTEETTLLPFLRSKIQDKSRNTVKNLLYCRQVMVGERIVTQFDTPLHPGTKITLLPKASAGAVELPFAILYEDADLLVVNKPAGLLSMGNEKERTRTAYRMASNYVKARTPGRRIFIVHRLDRDTSGVLLFAKNERMKHRLQDNWETLVKRRGYLAVVEGHLPQQEGTVTSYLRETSTHLVYSAPPGRDAKQAVTRYRTAAQAKGYTLVELDLETGRTHQIRVHMQDLGCPIAGDRSYGAKTDPFGRLALYAHVLALIDPRTKKNISFQIPLPPELKKRFPGTAIHLAEDQTCQ